MVNSVLRAHAPLYVGHAESTAPDDAPMLGNRSRQTGNPKARAQRFHFALEILETVDANSIDIRFPEDAPREEKDQREREKAADFQNARCAAQWFIRVAEVGRSSRAKAALVQEADEAAVVERRQLRNGAHRGRLLRPSGGTCPVSLAIAVWRATIEPLATRGEIRRAARHGARIPAGGTEREKTRRFLRVSDRFGEPSVFSQAVQALTTAC